MERFRDLRKVKGGTVRAAEFFRENLGKVVHRSIVQGLLFDQKDYMKRIRGNGGARDILAREDIAILSGAYRRDPIAALGLPVLAARMSSSHLYSVRLSVEILLAVRILSTRRPEPPTQPPSVPNFGRQCAQLLGTARISIQPMRRQLSAQSPQFSLRWLPSP